MVFIGTTVKIIYDIKIRNKDFVIITFNLKNQSFNVMRLLKISERVFDFSIKFKYFSIRLSMELIHRMKRPYFIDKNKK